jgi:hypothetical protein
MGSGIEIMRSGDGRVSKKIRVQSSFMKRLDTTIYFRSKLLKGLLMKTWTTD